MCSISIIAICNGRSGVPSCRKRHPRGRRRGTAPTVRHKLHIVCGCGKPRRLLIPLFLTSVKSHAAVRLFACKRAHDGALLLSTFYGINALTTAHSCYQLFTGGDGCGFQFRLLLRRMRFMWRSKLPLFIISARTSCSKVGTVQE